MALEIWQAAYWKARSFWRHKNGTYKRVTQEVMPWKTKAGYIIILPVILKLWNWGILKF